MLHRASRGSGREHGERFAPGDGPRLDVTRGGLPDALTRQRRSVVDFLSTDLAGRANYGAQSQGL